jgi:hypothetical protein
MSEVIELSEDQIQHVYSGLSNIGREVDRILEMLVADGVPPESPRRAPWEAQKRELAELRYLIGRTDTVLVKQPYSLPSVQYRAEDAEEPEQERPSDG